MKEFILNSSHRNGKATPIADGNALIITWSAAIPISTFNSISISINFQNNPQRKLDIILSPSTSEISVLKHRAFGKPVSYTRPWSNGLPFVVEKFAFECNIFWLDSDKHDDRLDEIISKQSSGSFLTIESVLIHTRIGVGNHHENFMVTGPFKVVVFDGELATALARFYAMEHTDRLTQTHTSDQTTTWNDKTALERYVRKLKDREKAVSSRGMVLGAKETSLDDRERGIGAREEDVVNREKKVANRERKVAEREQKVSDREQEAKLGQGRQDGSDNAPQSPSIRPTDYDVLEVAVNAWPTAVMMVLGAQVGVSLKKKHQRVMDEWVSTRGDSLSPDAYDYFVYSHGVAWPNVIPEDKFLAIRTEFKKLTK